MPPVIPEIYAGVPVSGTPEACLSLLEDDSRCQFRPVSLTLIGCICERIRVAYLCGECLDDTLSGTMGCERCLDRGFDNNITMIKEISRL